MSAGSSTGRGASMYILGINAYHGGASACLIKDGQLVAAVEEERFTRQKYWAGFPKLAIQYVLDEAGITVQDVDHIGISRDPKANLMKMALFAFRQRPSLSLVTDKLNNVMKVDNLQNEFSKNMGVEAASLKADFHNVEHHRAHMASAFFVSPYEDAAVLSIDGAGDFVTTMWGTGSGNTMNVDGLINFPHSLGIFYTAVTQILGFPKYGDEGKTMGLAPYGEPNYVDKMRKLVRIQSDGTFELDLDYFIHHAEGASMTWESGSPVLGRIYSDKMVELFGEPRAPRTEITQYHMDMSASMQVMLEEAEFAIIRSLQEKTGSTRLCMAGGVALNSAFNGKILPNTDFEDIYIHPAAGDAGTSLGVCYYIYNQVLGQPRNFEMTSAYTGPQWSNDQIKTALDEYNLDYKQLDHSDLIPKAADIVAQGDVLGWFQGRLEWGPRALGHRSIIANPTRDDMKDILNARVKHRETFRPFAPSILQEAVGDYFDQTYPDPFMLKVYGVLPEKQAEIPAVTHVDGTGRLQTVDKENSPLYWELINSFGEKTGTPVVLNTSFNENEPIVNTPQEAIDCFVRTKMDALGIGNYLVEKK
ncbi:carbamoyltransferase [Chloroflexota bacterium]